MYVAAAITRFQECLAVEEGLPTYAGTSDVFQDVKEERHTYYTGVQADATHIAAGQGLEPAAWIDADHPAQIIVRVAKEGGYGPAVMGHRGLCGVWGAFMGTTVEAEIMICHVACDVLVVR